MDRPPRPVEMHRERLLSGARKFLFCFNSGRIGDGICSTVIFRELKRANPSAEIHVLCSRGNAPFFKRCANVDKIWELPHPYRVFELAFAGLWLRRLHYDFAVAAYGAVRTRELLFLRLANPAVCIGFASAGLRLFSPQIDDSGRGIREILAQILSFAGVENFADDEYDCPRDPAAGKEISAFLEEEKIESGRFVALNLFGNQKNRKISAENAIAVICALYKKYSELGWKCVLLGSPKDDADVVKTLSLWKKKMGGGGYGSFLTAFRPTVSFFQNVELIARSGFLISPDTALVHVADALRIPMLVFFVPAELHRLRGGQSWMPHERSTTKFVWYRDNVNEIDFSDLPL